MIKDSNANSNDNALKVAYRHGHDHDNDSGLINPTTATATSSEDADVSPSISSKLSGYFSKSKRNISASAIACGIVGAAAVAGITGAATRSSQIHMRKNAAVSLFDIDTASIFDAVVPRVKSKSGKSEPGTSTPIPATGYYSGYDTEDGSPQRVYVFCGVETCNITIEDSRFSTCEQVLGAGEFFGGVGVARDVPVDSLDDFSIELYCIEEFGGSINFTKSPSSILTGDMQVLPNGQLIRTGPGFFYTVQSFVNPKEDGAMIEVEAVDIDDVGYNINGEYNGVDMSDGSGEFFNIACTKEFCDIVLFDQGFTQECENSRGEAFFNGVAFAKDVPRTSLSSFEVDLYCIEFPDLVINSTAGPDLKIPFELELLPDSPEGVMRNPLTDNYYYRSSYKSGEYAGFDTSFSLYEDFNAIFNALDTEDSSIQALQIDCKEGFCDLSLIDSSFSSCKDGTSGNAYSYLGGIAVAKNVSQNSLHDFQLELFCVEDISSIGIIDYDVTPIILTGDLVFLEDGIIKRTGPGFNYFASSNLDLQTNEVSGLYTGARLHDGGQQRVNILCTPVVDDVDECDIIVWTAINYECIQDDTSRFIINGIAVAKGEPRDALDGFYIDLYCVSPEAGVEIDYEADIPVRSFHAEILTDDNGKVVSLSLDADTIPILKNTPVPYSN